MAMLTLYSSMASPQNLTWAVVDSTNSQITDLKALTLLTIHRLNVYISQLCETFNLTFFQQNRSCRASIIDLVVFTVYVQYKQQEQVC